MTGITTIILKVPVWVWPLLLGLLFVGLKSTRARKIPVFLFYLLPLLIFMLVQRVVKLTQSLDEFALLYGAMFCAIGIGAYAGYRLQPRWIIQRERRLVHLRGEWVTLCTLMGIFWMNFVMGFLTNAAPQLLQSGVLPLAYIAVVGIFSGSLAGRALAVAKTPITGVTCQGH